MIASLSRSVARSRNLPDSLAALGVAVVCLSLYAPTLSPSVVAGDGGEFQMVSQVLGVAHPTGYPLFTLLGWLFGHLPLGGDAAFRVTLLGALTTAATMSALYLLVRELGGSQAPALAAALLAASMERIWRHAAATEVYPLSSLFMVLGWLLLIRWARGKTPLWVPTLLLGFGLTHHISLRLLGPAVLVFILVVQPRLVLSPRRWLPALLCLLLPLLLFAYIPMRADHFNSLPQLQGDILGIRKTVASGLVTPHYYVAGTPGLILASDYTAQITGSGNLNWSRAFSMCLDLTRQQFPLMVIPIALLGVVALLRRDFRASILLLLSFAATFAAAIFFLARVGEDGDHFIPAFLLTAVYVGLGAEALLAWGRRVRLMLLQPLIILGLMALVAANIAANYSTAMRARQFDETQGIFAQLPQGAVISGEWSVITPFRYHQQVDRVRSDLWFIHADAPGTKLLMQRAQLENVPFYAVRQTGSGLRLLPLPLRDATTITHPQDIALGPSLRWRGYDLATTTVSAGDEVLLTLYWQPMQRLDRNWTTFIHALDESGNKVAQVDRVALAGYHPPVEWQAGELLADQYEIALPPTLRPGRYQLVFGLYDGAQRLRFADGQDTHTLSEITVGQ